MDHDALRGMGYIGQARPQDVTPSFEFSRVDLCQLRKRKMVKSRKPLGSLAGLMNVDGDESLRNRVRPELTHVQRLAFGMWERREETWRPLNQQRVEAFIRLYLMALVMRRTPTATGEREEPRTPRYIEAWSTA